MNKADHIHQLEPVFWCGRLGAGSMANVVGL